MIFCISRRRQSFGTGLPSLVDPAGQPLRTYYNIADWNSATNAIVSRASTGDSSGHSAAANGSNGSTSGLINGIPAIIGTQYWLRIGNLTENVSPYAAPITDTMFTMVLRLTANPTGTIVGTATTRVLTDSSGYWGACLYRVAGVNYIAAQGLMTSAATGLTYAPNTEHVVPSLGTAFVFQWGVRGQRIVSRINLGPYVFGNNTSLGAAPWPNDAVYTIGAQNFHFGYSPAGATHYYNGDLGDILSTIGTRTQKTYDELAYWEMNKYGISP